LKAGAMMRTPSLVTDTHSGGTAIVLPEIADNGCSEITGFYSSSIFAEFQSREQLDHAGV